MIPEDELNYRVWTGGDGAICSRWGRSESVITETAVDPGGGGGGGGGGSGGG